MNRERPHLLPIELTAAAARASKIVIDVAMGSGSAFGARVTTHHTPETSGDGFPNGQSR